MISTQWGIFLGGGGGETISYDTISNDIVSFLLVTN